MLKIRRDIFLKKINKPIIYNFFKDFTNHRKKTNWAVVLGSTTLPDVLNIQTTDEIFQQSEQKRFL